MWNLRILVSVLNGGTAEGQRFGFSVSHGGTKVTFFTCHVILSPSGARQLSHLEQAHAFGRLMVHYVFITERRSRK